jgi:hypothetical protein
MPLTPGLVPNLREVAPEPTETSVDDDLIVKIDEEGPSYDTDDNGNILKIEHEDGSVTISLDGRPVEEASEASEAEKAANWFRNLVDDIDSGELSAISETLMNGIRDDLDSRRDWVEDRAQGLKLLGLKIEIPGLEGASDGAPIEGMSKVRHPLLLEAVLRFQANARSELLPTDGPVKIRNDAIASSAQQDFFSNALEKDLNHYLTSTATEYYPDTDRMLLMLGFGGTSFKKVYFCPLRNRPVSESVDADDLIVNNSATDLQNARRVTHRVMMRPSTVKRLQILGVYRDVELSTPMQTETNAVQREKNSIEGVTNTVMRPDDRDREIYECYCELNINGFEHKWKGKETGLEIPYRVTIDASTKEILSIVRNYDEDEEELPTARQNFVKYTFVPGLGFYDIGLLHILGNTTNAVTAAWREMLDAGMYSNFPGFLYADTGARQNTNIFRVPPGGGALVKTGGMPIQQAVMPLPYKDPSSALMTLVDNMAQTGMRVGGTAEMAVGEGKADAPVGTTLALIDQATKVLNAVHKRMHSAQANEFQLLVRCFREHPESFWQRNKKPAYQWSEQTFMQALNDCDLVPQADPNTSSHTQRMMKVMALKQLQSANPSLYDPIAVDTEAMITLGWSNPEQFFAPPDAQNAPPPQVLEAQAKIQIAQQEADSKTMLAQAKAAEIAAKVQTEQMGNQVDPIKATELQIKQDEIQQRNFDAQLDAINRKRDRESRERLATLKLAEEISQNPASLGIINEIVGMNMIQKLRDVEPPLEPQSPPSMGVPPEEEPIQ